MQLTNIQYSRAFAFMEMLKMTLPQNGKTPRDGYEKDVEGEARLPKLNEQAIGAIQRGTVTNASIFAEQNFPEISFPDETERETEAPEAPEAEGFAGDVFSDEPAEPTEAELAEV